MAMIVAPKSRAEQLKLANLDNYGDHYSLMCHLEREVCREWKIDKPEFYDMLNEYLIARGKAWDSDGDRLVEELDSLPDHFKRNGKEYALMITKCKKGKWQRLYAV